MSRFRYDAALRHGYTNYDELIRPLDRYDIEHQMYYQAIRNRIDELLEQAKEELKEKELEDDDDGDDWDEDDDDGDDWDEDEDE